MSERLVFGKFLLFCTKLSKWTELDPMFLIPTGLCGVLDGNKDNDFTKADGSVYVPSNAAMRFPNEFTITWRYAYAHLV